MDSTFDYSSLSKKELVAIIAQKDIQINNLKKQLGLTLEGRIQNRDSLICEESGTSVERLSSSAIRRFSRQLILPQVGPKGQLRLQNASVLVVGCGGLGCPSALYIAAAGIGEIGLVDYDDVELSNLRRQVLHTEETIGTSKAFSVLKSLRALNSSVRCATHVVALNSHNAMEIIPQYDIVVDCTDNVATRYLLNDACVLLKKPLVSGSALRFEGQLSVYNYNDGPCYRCLFPEPPPPATVTNCSDGGVLGVIPGVIGLLQALEVIKMVISVGCVNSGALLLFNGLDFTFRNVKLRRKRPNCAVCGLNPTVTSLIDYAMFCGGANATDKDKGIQIRAPQDRITVQKYNEIIIMKTPHVLLDVRLPVELEICALPNAFNVPFADLECAKSMKAIEDKMLEVNSELLVCVCHRGNDSQRSASILSVKFSGRFKVIDIIGGLDAWSSKIDKTFPVY